MRFFRNSVSFLAVLCVLPTAFGATSRVGVVTNASRRLPTLNIKTVATTTTNTTSSSNLLADSECIDAYTSCMKGDEACGSDFEECTTNVLFHGKMPQCFSTLYQCSTSGISSLFGTSSVDSLSNVQTKNTANEVTRYTYPTDGSVMGQLIIGSSISNRYDTANCVKKYKSCLFKDSVCGEDFELCTTDTQFKKQSALCDSVLGRCQDAGIKELFGQTASAKPVGSVGSGVVAEWMSDGADLAASNAVNTCYKVIDNCFLSACQGNPYRCVEGANLSVVTTADLIGGTETAALNTNANEDAQSNATIKKFFKSSCLDTIGTNKYCYMTFHDGDTPKKTDLTDPDNQEDLFSEAYSTRKTYINSKLQDLVSVFDTKAKNACVETIRSCAMRSCGGGTGVGCYSKVFGAGEGATNTINGNTTYDEIKNGCSAVVNTDPNCKYSAATYNASSGNTYSYSFNDNDAFGILFPQQDSLTTATTADPIGAVASLNATLSTSYNENAIAQMKKQCQNVATNCVKSMCGTDYVNCYRNRTDAYSNLTNSGNDGFDKSMNKVGGVLDYTIVLGLCMNTVKTADACEESLAIARANVDTSNWKDSTGSTFNSLRNAWQDAGSITRVDVDYIQDENDGGKKLCECDDGGIDVCATEKDGKTNCNEPHMISLGTKVENTAVNTLFRELVADIEMEAQAKYNAKLTKEQNVCLANNNGGIKGTKDTGSAFMWVKLKSKVNDDYGAKGLQESDFTASNDLYGSFCRARIDLRSTDATINLGTNDGQNNVNLKSTYFAVGDTFTCGSWLTEQDLKTITEKKQKQAVEALGGTFENGKTKMSAKDKWTVGLTTAVSALVGGGAGYALMDSAQRNGKTLGGLISKKTSVMDGGNDNANKCIEWLDRTRNAIKQGETGLASQYLNSAKIYAGKIDKNEVDAIYSEKTITKNSSVVRYRKADYDEALQNAKKALQNAKKAVQKAPQKAQTTEAEKLKKDLEPSDGSEETGNTNEKATTAENTAQAVVTALEALGVPSDSGMTGDASAVKEAINEYKSAAREAKITTVTIKEPIAYSEFDSIGDINAIIAELDTLCTRNDDVNAEAEAKARRNTDFVGAGIGALALGGTGFAVSKSLVKQKYDDAKQEAYDEWMNNIGSKIKCYIGAEEIGGFGDVISITLDE